MDSFADVIDLWPHTDILAEDIGEKPDTVRKWRQRGSIPADCWLAILLAAKRRRYKLRESTLIELAAQKKAAA